MAIPKGKNNLLLVCFFTTLLTFVIYGRAVSLGFFFDDIIHLRWLDWHSLPSIWTSAEGLGYYRPLPFSLWKVSHLVLGHFSPFWLHLVNLILHALNAVLLYRFAYGLFDDQRRSLYAIAAALIFITYPFSYQAIPFVGALCHPLGTFLVLSSVISYWEARTKDSKPFLFCSLCFAFIAPFASENGVLVAPLLIGIEILGFVTRDFSRLSWRPLGYLAISFGYTIVWSIVPKSRGPLHLPSLETLWQNGAYFLQGFVSPTAPLAKTLMRISPLNDLNAVALVAIFTFILLFTFFKRAERTVLLIFSVGWFVISVLPACLMLKFSYIIDGPRLLYLASAGIALLWAGIPAVLWSSRAFRRLGPLLAVAVLLIMLWMNITFLRSRMELYVLGADFLSQVTEAAKASIDGESLLYINIPSWLTPKEPTYALGHEGVTFIPGYVGVRDFIYVNSELEREVNAVTFANVQRHRRYYIGYYGPQVGWEGLDKAIRKAKRVYVTDYLPARLRLVEAGALERDSEFTKGGALAMFGDCIALIKGSSDRRNHESVVTLWWGCLCEMEDDYSVFVHVYDGEGHLVAQRDGYSLLGLFPLWLWQEGDLVRDVRQIALPEDLPRGRYTLAVGVYDPDTGMRMPALDDQRFRCRNDAVSVLTFSWEGKR